MDPALDVDPDLDAWRLSAEEYELSAAKSSVNRLDFALLLKSFQGAGRFPNSTPEIRPDFIECVAQQLGVEPVTVGAMSDRTRERARAEIRNFCGFREATIDDAEQLTEWLCEHIVATSLRGHDGLIVAIEGECRERRIEPPAADRVDRIVRSALRTHEEQFCAATVSRLSGASRARLDALLHPTADIDGGHTDEQRGDDQLEEPDAAEPASSTPARAVINELRSDPGRPSVNSLRKEMAKLQILRRLELPADLFDGTRSRELEIYRKRVAVEEPYELRRHPDNARLTWLAAFAVLRSREITDNLVDLLVETIHHINARAERRVEHELLEDLRRVSGKQNLLFQVADAALAHPDGVVRDVVFPIVNEVTLQALVKEWKATGPMYRTTLRAFIRGSYKSHYRKMVPELLRTLAFRSNNEVHRPVMRALDVLERYASAKQSFYPIDEDVPLGFVRGLWREAVVEDTGDGRPHVNRVTYEICVLEALREQLRCKEIWVVGADRYRNPDEDVPADFESRRAVYYAALGLPRDADVFVDRLRNEMQDALHTLNDNLPCNPSVTISSKAGGWIGLSPLATQPEPENLAALKAEVGSLWLMTSLLDMLKETDLRLNFTAALRSVTSHEKLDRETLRPRLLLCLHGIGTNAGLQRMNPTANGATYKDLLYVRRRYITVDQLRTAIGIVTNGTLNVRNSAIWGEGTAACASDSKHFGAWDQNLMTQWHLRYGGRGIMIYWHVDRKSLCVYSQLKSPASSEAAAMIEGVLRHCTEMAIDKQYVDSHGQSEVAFAFCRLLGFQLLPRLKPIHSQRLYRPESPSWATYRHLNPVLGRAIDWELIARQYDEMAKYATALRLGTAQSEAILRRFTRSNVQHPTYKALAELGKAVKTIFLSRYLHEPALRREIHEGLNVIEQWNGANDFVFFGKHGEFASNEREDNELSMLALHLLQNCMVYINTLMLQQILAEPHWRQRLTPIDRRALTPLIWGHVNPYGRYELDMDARLLLTA